MTPPQFTKRAQSLGLSYKGVSIWTAQTLAEIAVTPMPFIQQVGPVRKATNARPRALSPLINHGMARLNHAAYAYEATDKGREYLVLLRHHGLLPAEQPVTA